MRECRYELALVDRLACCLDSAQRLCALAKFDRVFQVLRLPPRPSMFLAGLIKWSSWPAGSRLAGQGQAAPCLAAAAALLPCLALLVQCASLAHLYLCSNDIGAEGAGRLSAELGQYQCRPVRLDDCPKGDAGCDGARAHRMLGRGHSKAQAGGQ